MAMAFHWPLSVSRLHLMLGMVNLSGTEACVGQKAKHWGWPYGSSMFMQSLGIFERTSVLQLGAT